MGQFGRSQPIKPWYSRGSVTPGLLFDSLTDDFSTGSVDTAKWPANQGTTSVTGGRARVQVSTGFSNFRSAEQYALLGSYILLRIDTWPAPSTATTAFVEINVTSGQVATGTQLNFKADVVSGLLTASNQVGFADGGAVSTPFSTGAPLWLRIDGRAVSSLTFDYSLTGNPSGWTTLRTLSTPDWITTSALRGGVQGHRDAGVTDFFEFDDFNLPTSDPATPSPIWRPAPWKRIPGSFQYQKGFHPGEATTSPLVVMPFSGRKPFPLPPGGQFHKGVDTRVPPSSITAVGLDGALQVPLGVRLKNDVTDVYLVAELKDLNFRSVANGGFASCTLHLDRPLNIAAPETDQFTRVYITDTRSGSTVWEGRLEDPGRTATDRGLTWEVTAMGPSAHAKDETFVYPLIDSKLDGWEKFGGSKLSSQVASNTDSSDRDGIKVSFAGGVNVATPDYVAARYLNFISAGTSLARITATAYAGGTGQWDMSVYAYGPAGPEQIDNVTWQTSPYVFSGEAGSEFSSGQTTPHLRADRTGLAAAPDDNAYVFFYNIIVQSVRVDEEGNAVTSYPHDYVLASEIVQDLIGAHTTLYDGLDAFIDDTFNQITQFSYPDGITVYDALNDVIQLEGAFYWAAWETIPRSGKWRFEFRAWPTTVRYEAGIDDGWQSPGSATDLFNAVDVHWTDARGRDRTTTRTSSVDELTRAGITRTARIDLGDENGSSQAAIDAGDEFLADHAVPSQNGRLTIARPILDFDRGMLVDPWMIRPGGLIRVRDVDPRRDALNPAGRDGSTVFRIVSTEYRASDNSCQLELDQDALSTSRAIAKLKAQQQAPKRRRGRH